MPRAISRTGLKRFIAANNGAAECAAKQATTSVRRWMAAHPNASAEELREFSIDCLQASVSKYGDAAGQLALEQVSQQLTEEIGKRVDVAELMRVSTASVYDETASGVKRSVRYQIQKYLDGDLQGYLDSIGEAAEYYTRQMATDATIDAIHSVNGRAVGETAQARRSRLDRNAARRRELRREAREANVAYARVVQGMEACEFCRMLASRGAVYRSRETAEMAHSRHRNCKCVVIAAPYGTRKFGGIDCDREKDAWGELRWINVSTELDKATRNILLNDVAGHNLAQRSVTDVDDLLAFKSTTTERYIDAEHGRWAAAGEEIERFNAEHPNASPEQERDAVLEILHRHFPKDFNGADW